MRRGLRGSSPRLSYNFESDAEGPARPRAPGGGGEGEGEAPWTVTQLTRRIKGALEGAFARVMVEGEIGSLTRAASGHLYITLKDAGATLDVVMWRSAASRLRERIEEGMQVVVRGAVTVYAPRGRYQLVAHAIRPLGRGDLQARFEALVARLADEGLFEAEHKRPLPPWPKTIGVVTSPTGAAVRDIIKVLRRRMRGARIVVSPCRVQGERAAAEIVAALDRIEAWGGCDVLIVGRGGGSLEDLWAFNEEAVARRVFACATPVVSAVGHEVDLTVCDLVADLRAATPSEAAETVAPDLRAYARDMRRLETALARALLSRVREGRLRLRALAQSPALRRPLEMIRARAQRLDEAALALTDALRSAVETRRRRLELTAARLEGRSPLAVLARGFSLTTTATGTVLRDAAAVQPGDALVTHLAHGRVRATVTATEPPPSP